MSGTPSKKNSRVIAAVVIIVIVIVASVGAYYYYSSTSSSSSTMMSSTMMPSTSMSSTLLIDGAGTLAVPWNGVVNGVLRPQYPTISYNYIFEGSHLAANEITQANKSFDVFGSADYRIIPEQLMPKYASWYIIFASNAMTVMYTNRSKFANEITSQNWYQVITRPGVIVGVSKKDTDPSGAQAIIMLELAGLEYYNNASYIYDQLYVTKAANHELVIVPTETTLNPQLETGTVDYVLTYSSEAITHKFPYLNLDSRVNLSNVTLSNWYAQANVTVNGKSTQGTPILYDLTIPTNSPDPAMGAAFVVALFSPQGQEILHSSGITPLSPVDIYNPSAVPPSIIQALSQSGISVTTITATA